MLVFALGNLQIRIFQFFDLNEVGQAVRIVYRLSDELEKDPGRVALTQALTLNTSKPFAGLKGAYGLFGSAEWWRNIEKRKIPLLFLSGLIQRVYFAGQDSFSGVNFADGSVREESIYASTHKANRELFVVGARVEIIYVLDELKSGAVHGDETHHEIVLEMAISL